MKEITVSDIEAIRNSVLECAELADGIKSLMAEEGYTGVNGLWNITKQLYSISEQLGDMMQGGDDNE